MLDENKYQNEIDSEPSVVHNKGLGLFIGAFTILGILAMLVALGYFLIFIPALPEIEASEAEEFFQQFLASLIDDTDFYKQHSEESVIQQIQTNRSLFSKNYKDYRDKCQRGWYEYSVVFGEKHVFEMVIEGTNRNFSVSDFKYSGIAKKATWSDARTKEQALSFFKKFISSINADTDFYKKHSNESTIQAIQNYRHMISKNNVLFNRVREGENDFYFYISFDMKYNFEVYFDAHKNMVQSFIYLGKVGEKTKMRG